MKYIILIQLAVIFILSTKVRNQQKEILSKKEEIEFLRLEVSHLKG